MGIHRLFVVNATMFHFSQIEIVFSGHSGLVGRFYYLQNIFVVDGERNLEYFLTKVFRALPVDSIAHSPPHSVLNYRENILQIMSYIDRGT